VETVNFTVATREKPSPKLEKALEYLREHPELMKESSRSLSAVLGISHTYVNKAKQIIEEQDHVS
jgi:DNA-binding transcriptional regulator of glucitol operon